jgi:hypothetical protein
MGGCLCAPIRIVEGLKAGLEHGRHSNLLRAPGNAGMRYTLGTARGSHF